MPEMAKKDRPRENSEKEHMALLYSKGMNFSL